MDDPYQIIGTEDAPASILHQIPPEPPPPSGFDIIGTEAAPSYIQKQIDALSAPVAPPAAAPRPGWQLRAVPQFGMPPTASIGAPAQLPPQQQPMLPPPPQPMLPPQPEIQGPVLRGPRPTSPLAAIGDKIVHVFDPITDLFARQPSAEAQRAAPFDKTELPPVERPLLKLSELDQSGAPQTIPAGIRRGALQAAEGFTSLQGIGMILGLGKIGKLPEVGAALTAAMGAGFDANMIASSIAELPAAKEQWDRGNRPEAARIWAQAVLSGGMGLFGAQGKAREMAHGAPVSERPLTSTEQQSLQDRLAPMGGKQLKREAEKLNPAAADVAREAASPYPTPEVTPGTPGVPMSRQQRRATVQVPESGPSEGVQRGQAAREQLAQDLFGRPFADLSNPDRIAIDALVAEGHGGSVAAAPAPPAPAGHPAARRVTEPAASGGAVGEGAQGAMPERPDEFTAKEQRRAPYAYGAAADRAQAERDLAEKNYDVATGQYRDPQDMFDAATERAGQGAAANYDAARARVPSPEDTFAAAQARARAPRPEAPASSYEPPPGTPAAERRAFETSPEERAKFVAERKAERDADYPDKSFDELPEHRGQQPPVQETAGSPGEPPQAAPPQPEAPAAPEPHKGSMYRDAIRDFAAKPTRSNLEQVMLHANLGNVPHEEIKADLVKAGISDFQLKQLFKTEAGETPGSSPGEPPDVLYHGASDADSSGIHGVGLAPGTHFTHDKDYALQAAHARTRFVGGKPIVIAVDRGATEWEPVSGGHVKSKSLIRPDAFRDAGEIPAAKLKDLRKQRQAELAGRDLQGQLQRELLAKAARNEGKADENPETAPKPVSNENTPEKPARDEAAAETDFQTRLAANLKQARQQAHVDHVNETAALTTYRDLLAGATHKGRGTAAVGTRDAVLTVDHQTRKVKQGRKTVTENYDTYKAKVTDQRRGPIEREFNKLDEAVAWATDKLHGIGEGPDGWSASRWSRHGTTRGSQGLVDGYGLLGNSEHAWAASQAAAEAFGRPDLASDIHMSAFAGGSKAPVPGLTLKTIARDVADRLPRNESALIDDRSYKYGGTNPQRELVGANPPATRTDFDPANHERAAGQLKERLADVRKKIADAKDLNGGTTPRIGESESYFNDVEKNIERNLKHVQDAAEIQKVEKIEKLEPKAREQVAAFAKYGDAGLTAYNSNQPWHEYAKLRGMEDTSGPAMMKHFGIAEQERPARVPVKLTGPGRLSKAEIEALREANLAEGTIHIKDTGMADKFRERGWIGEAGEWPAKLTDAGKSAVYSLHESTGELKAGRPMSEYRPTKGHVDQMGESRFGGGASAWGKDAEGNVWHTNGHGAWKGEYPNHWTPRDPNKPGPDVSRIIPKENGEAIRPVGFTTVNAGEGKGKGKGVNKERTLVHFNNGTAIDSSYYDYTVKRYGRDVKWSQVRSSESPVQAFDKDGKRVAVIMPMRVEGLPEALKGEAAKESAPQGAPQARKRKPSERGGITINQLTLGLHDYGVKHVVPGAQSVGKAFAEGVDTIRRVFAPQSRKTEVAIRDDAGKVIGTKKVALAEQSADFHRERMANNAREYDRAVAALAQAKDHFLGKDLHADIVPFLDRMERGERQVKADGSHDPQLQAFADTMRAVLDKLRARVQDLGTGKLEKFLADYFPHIWKDVEKARIAYSQVQPAKFEGSKAFLHKRTVDSIANGILPVEEGGRGLVPRYENPVDMVLAKMGEMQKYILAHEAMNYAKESGYSKYVPEGYSHPAGWVTGNDSIYKRFTKHEVVHRATVDRPMMERLNDLAHSLGIATERPLRLTRGTGGTLGYTIEGADKVWTRFGTPEQVLAHEIGHQLEFKYNLYDYLKGIPGVGKELRALADMRIEGYDPAAISAHYKQYIRNKDEKIANAIAALVYMPDRFKQVAPETFDMLRDELWHHKELRPIFDVQRTMVPGNEAVLEKLPGMVEIGRYYMPQEVMQLFDNHLSPGLRHHGAFNMYLGAANSMNQFQLGFSAFHAGFTTLDSIVSKAALAIEQGTRGVGEVRRGNVASGAKLLGQSAKSAAIAAVPFAAPIENVVRGNALFKAWRDAGISGTPEGAPPQMAALLNALVQGGGRVTQDSFYHARMAERFTQALRAGDGWHAAVLAVPALADVVAKPVMEKLVPRMKLGVFADLAKMEMQRFGEMAARGETVTAEMQRAAYGKAWDSVDNRMGQLVYDNLFWNKTAKDMAMASVRSLGWNIGTFRELGGAVVDTATVGKRLKAGDPAMTHRMAYAIALPAVTALIGGTMTYLLTGKGPEEAKDYFFPRTGNTDENGRPERVSLPSYMKDVWHYGTSILDRNLAGVAQTLVAKAHPLVSMIGDMLQNKDYYGTQIYSPDTIGQDLLAYMGKQIIPFAARGLMKERERGGSVANMALPFIGVTPAPSEVNKTPAERMIDRYTQDSASKASKSPEQYERGRVMREVTRAMRMGKRDDALRMGGKALDEGYLADRDMDTAAARAEKNPLQAAFLHLQDAMKATEVMGVASEEERQLLAAEYTKKYNHLENKSPREREAVEKRMLQLGLLKYLQ